MILSRKAFFKTGFFASAGLLLPGVLASPVKSQEKPAPLDPNQVREFVRVCHFDFDRVKEMLEANPLLLHSSWDLGGGDFESGIEAAGHVGNKEIAGYLLSKGARYNVFLAAMFGDLTVVKFVLNANPQLLNAKGPHGLTLLHHARKGGESSKPVEDFLASLGATETKINFYGYW